MDLSKLTAISPVDGRYRNKVSELAPYFSEYAWIRYRLKVEIEYFIALTEVPLPGLEKVDPQVFPILRMIYDDFTMHAAQSVKLIESETNHDVKAVEYFLKEQLGQLNLGAYQEYVHFALTSQDINNTAIPLLIKDFLEKLYQPLLDKLKDSLATLAETWKEIPMLARTHGQAASPTLLGKEFMVFVQRLRSQSSSLLPVEHTAKFGGANGNFNAHVVAFPEIDWIAFADRFLESLGLIRNPFTTQIEPYDSLASLLDNLKRINTILIDLSRDIWHYISIDYFKQKVVKNEVGSSAMPHKVNPIDFENAEGNLGFANAIFDHLSQKLPISRLQRDLTDSTVLRNLGVPMAHTMIGFQSILKGLSKLELNPDQLNQDLEKNWVVVSEAIQTILRREAYPQPYEALKEFTRGKSKINQQTIHQFIEQLDIKPEIKEELKRITPFNYVGIVPKFL